VATGANASDVIFNELSFDKRKKTLLDGNDFALDLFLKSAGNNPGEIHAALSSLKHSNQVHKAMRLLSSMNRIDFFPTNLKRSIPMSGAILDALVRGSGNNLARHIEELGPLVAVYHSEFANNKGVAQPDFVFDLASIYGPPRSLDPRPLALVATSRLKNAVPISRFFQSNRELLKSIFDGLAQPQWLKSKARYRSNSYAQDLAKVLSSSPSAPARAIHALFLESGMKENQRESFLLRQVLSLSRNEVRHMSGRTYTSSNNQRMSAFSFLTGYLNAAAKAGAAFEDSGQPPRLLDAPELRRQAKEPVKDTKTFVKEEEAAAIEGLVGPNKPYAQESVKKALAEGRSWLRTLKADNQINAAILRNAKALTFYSSLQDEDGRPRKFTLAASSPRPLVTDIDGLLSFTLVTQQSQWGPQSINDLYGKLAALGPLLSIQEWSGVKHLVRVRDLFQTLFPSWLPRGQLHADHELLQMRNKLGPKAMYLNNREKVLQAIQLGRTAMIHAQSRRNFEKAL
jgi:hypothetical protein